MIVIDDNLVQPQGLIDEHKEKSRLGSQFPPSLDQSLIQNAISRYQQYTQNTRELLDYVCCSCARFTSFQDIYQISKDDQKIDTAVTSNILSLENLDVCGCSSTAYNFCRNCWTALEKSQVPKFGFKNGMPTVACQLYPSPLLDLTPAEETVIAKAHPIIKILKLRPNGKATSASYNGIRGHAIVFPQNPGPLLTLLPSDTVCVEDNIRVVWLGLSKPRSEDLARFILVRKTRILVALEWLKINNPVYYNIGINYSLLQDWEEEFIPQGLLDQVVHCEPDNSERDSYAVPSNGENFENDLDHAITEAGIEGDAIQTGCVYSDIDDNRQNPTLKLLSAIDNTNSGTNPSHDAHPAISYQAKGQLIPLNDWENPHYFTAAFPTLFPFGDGGHIEKRSRPLSIQAWAKWSLEHHARR